MINNEIKLHLGCGEIHLDGWVNIDIESTNADLIHDLRNPLPFDTDSVSYIYAEHFIEHLSQADAKALLSECHRVLRDKGAIRLTTPNLAFLLSTYFSGDLQEWSEYWVPATKAHMVNEGMRSWGHQFIYDAEELARFIFECGFGFIKFEQWRQSDISHFSNIESRNYHKELIVEAYKDSSISPPFGMTNVNFDKLKIDELTWSSQLNDKKNELIRKLEAHNLVLSNFTERLQTEQREYNKDLLKHINNQELYIKQLVEELISLKCALSI